MVYAALLSLPVRLPACRHLRNRHEYRQPNGANEAARTALIGQLRAASVHGVHCGIAGDAAPRFPVTPRRVIFR